MNARRFVWVGVCLAACGAAASLESACGGQAAPPKTTALGGTLDQSKWPADDRSLCEGFVHWRNNPQLEFSETAGTGSIRPNVRRIYKLVGEKDDRHEVVLCREVDTNLDGLKDVVRTFNEKGEPAHEEADTNYDGRIDNWVNFAAGRIVEEDLDTTYSTGKPNEWKYYVNGELSRIKKNTHCPGGKPDVWEIYFKNHMERIGNDSSCDGHIDRWDRDAILLAQEEGVQIEDGGAAAPSNDGGASPGAEGGAAPAASSGHDEEMSVKLSDAGAKSKTKKKKGG
jgi:hypothetical protein